MSAIQSFEKAFTHRHMDDKWSYYLNWDFVSVSFKVTYFAWCNVIFSWLRDIRVRARALYMMYATVKRMNLAMGKCAQTCAVCEGLDQPASVQSNQSFFCPLEASTYHISKAFMSLWKKKISRRITVFTGLWCQKIHFLTPRLRHPGLSWLTEP